MASWCAHRSTAAAIAATATAAAAAAAPLVLFVCVPSIQRGRRSDQVRARRRLLLTWPGWQRLFTTAYRCLQRLPCVRRAPVRTPWRPLCLGDRCVCPVRLLYPCSPRGPFRFLCIAMHSKRHALRTNTVVHKLLCIDTVRPVFACISRRVSPVYPVLRLFPVHPGAFRSVRHVSCVPIAPVVTLGGRERSGPRSRRRLGGLLWRGPRCAPPPAAEIYGRAVCGMRRLSDGGGAGKGTWSPQRCGLPAPVQRGALSSPGEFQTYLGRDYRHSAQGHRTPPKRPQAAPERHQALSMQDFSSSATPTQ